MSQPEKIKRKYLLKKDKLDPNNPLHVVHEFDISRTVLPPVVDHRPACPPVYDQGDLGSCTANGIAAVYQYDQMKQHEAHIIAPSRLFIYYNERKIEHSVSEDSGAAIVDGITSVHTTGVCTEDQWPYDVSKFAVAPSADLYRAAAKHKTGTYKRLAQNLVQLKTALAQGNLVVFGITVYDSFESDAVAATGIVPMPNTNTEQQLGGHCIVLVGYDEPNKRFIVRNSWGTGWALGGYFYLPYDYVMSTDLSSDFWTIFTVVDKA